MSAIRDDICNSAGEEIGSLSGARLQRATVLAIYTAREVVDSNQQGSVHLDQSEVHFTLLAL